MIIDECLTWTNLIDCIAKTISRSIGTWTSLNIIFPVVYFILFIVHWLLPTELSYKAILANRCVTSLLKLPQFDWHKFHLRALRQFSGTQYLTIQDFTFLPPALYFLLFSCLLYLPLFWKHFPEKAPGWAERHPAHPLVTPLLANDLDNLVKLQKWVVCLQTAITEATSNHAKLIWFYNWFCKIWANLFTPLCTL